MRFMVLGAALAAFATPVVASDWRIVYADAQSVSAIDLSGVRTVGDRKVAWTATLYPETQEGGVDYNLVRLEYDCVAATATQLTFVAYTAAGNSLEASYDRHSANAVIPNSFGETTFNAACYGEGVRETSYSNPSDMLTDYRALLTD